MNKLADRIGLDNLEHFFAGGIVFIMFFLGTKTADGMFEMSDLVCCAAMSVLAGLLQEISNKVNGEQFSWVNILATSVGGFIFALSIFFTTLITN